MKFSSFLAVLFLVNPVFAQTQKLNFIDYGNQKYSIELVREKAKITLVMNGFTNPAVALTQVMDGNTPVDGAYDSGVLKADVRSKSYSSFAIHSLRLGLQEGKNVEVNKKSVADIRDEFNKLHKEGRVQTSGDVLCPKSTVGIIVLNIKDAFPFPFCVFPD